MTSHCLLGLVAVCGWTLDSHARCVALEGAKVYLPGGPRTGAKVVLKEEVILGVDGPTPDGCETVDVSGKVLTPGLIDAHTQLGLVEIELEPFTVDADAGSMGDPAGRPVRASFGVADAYHPRSTLIPVTRLGGVTSAVVLPGGGVVSGRSSWVDLAGGTQREAVRNAQLALHMAVGGGLAASRADSWNLVRALFEEGRRFASRKADWDQNKLPELLFDVRELGAVAPVLDGTMPLVVRADRASDLEAALRLAKDLGLRLVIDGGAEAWLMAEELGKRRVPVILDAYRYAPSLVDDHQARPDNAAILHRAGVPIILSAYQSHNARTLRQLAGNAVREGLDHPAAIRAITQNPADAFGMIRHGRITVGSLANLVVWSGDPLEIATRVERLYIGGREIKLESRQTRLRDRYRTLIKEATRP
jgi:imidazolonepropionase-like amidohydrolase